MFVYVIALVLGILFTIRKLDTRRREPAHHPQVDPAAFARWKRMELSAYNIGSFACFSMILIDLGFQLLADRAGLEWKTVRVVGASIFLLWVGAVIVAAVRAGAGRRLRTELGIDLNQPLEPPRPEGRSDDTGT
jgi:hypothetical protein